MKIVGAISSIVTALGLLTVSFTIDLLGANTSGKIFIIISYVMLGDSIFRFGLPEYTFSNILHDKEKYSDLGQINNHLTNLKYVAFLLFIIFILSLADTQWLVICCLSLGFAFYEYCARVDRAFGYAHAIYVWACSKTLITLTTTCYLVVALGVSESQATIAALSLYLGLGFSYSLKLNLNSYLLILLKDSDKALKNKSERRRSLLFHASNLTSYGAQNFLIILLGVIGSDVMVAFYRLGQTILSVILFFQNMYVSLKSHMFLDMIYLNTKNKHANIILALVYLGLICVSILADKVLVPAYYTEVAILNIISQNWIFLGLVGVLLLLVGPQGAFSNARNNPQSVVLANIGSTVLISLAIFTLYAYPIWESSLVFALPILWKVMAIIGIWAIRGVYEGRG